MARTRIAEFGIIQKPLALATVAIYVADSNGENTGVLATLYQAATGSGQRSNPQILDTDGKLANDCWVEDYVLAEISNISETIERSIRKIRVNPLQYPLPVTSSTLNTANVGSSASIAVAAAASATTSAATSTTAATTATTQAGISTTGATTATTQAGIATTQAGLADTARIAAQAAAAGMKWKNSAKAGTTADITLSGAQTIDTIALIAGDRCLVKDQSTAAQNGIYVVASGSWARAADMDDWLEIPSASVAVEQGATNADKAFICTSDAGGTLGTTAITWSSFGAGYTGGNFNVTGEVIAIGRLVTAQYLTLGVLGSDPAFPENGNLWTKATGLFTRYGGTIRQLLAGKATQAEMESQTADVYADAASMKFNPLMPKAWVRVTGSTGAIVSSSGVSGVTRNGTGDYTITWTTAFSNTNYGILGNVINGSAKWANPGTLATGTANFRTYNQAGAAEDVDFFAVAFGDL